MVVDPLWVLKGLLVVESLRREELVLYLEADGFELFLLEQSPCFVRYSCHTAKDKHALLPSAFSQVPR